MANIEIITILLTVLHSALSSITNSELIQEIHTMISTAKILNNLNTTRSEPLHNSLTHPFTPSPTNGLSLPTQLRSLQSKIFFSIVAFYIALNNIHSGGCIRR
jgi:hypothetical protein